MSGSPKIFLMHLLNSGGAEILQDHLRKRLRRVILGDFVQRAVAFGVTRPIDHAGKWKFTGRTFDAFESSTRRQRCRVWTALTLPLDRVWSLQCLMQAGPCHSPLPLHNNEESRITPEKFWIFDDELSLEVAKSVIADCLGILSGQHSIDA